MYIIYRLSLRYTSPFYNNKSIFPPFYVFYVIVVCLCIYVFVYLHNHVYVLSHLRHWVARICVFVYLHNNVFVLSHLTQRHWVALEQR